MHADTNNLKSQSGCIQVRQSRIQNKEYYQGEGGYYIMIKESICQDIIILNVYLSNSRATKHMNQKVKRTKTENRQTHNYSWMFQQSSLSQKNLWKQRTISSYNSTKLKLTELSTHQERNTSACGMDHLPRYTIVWAIKHVSINFKVLK